MQKLKQIAEGEYFLGNQPVTPILVYGPVMYTYDYIDKEHIEVPIGFLVEKIKAETGVDLERIANSFHSGGISVSHGEIFTRHEIIMFFNSRPKPLN